ncbi:MAG: hypothetical protein IJX14_05055, partial [Clostridia bacterium]|nr:hypothetical protein [Clostridia bacterium]
MRKQFLFMTILLFLSVLLLVRCREGKESLFITEPGADAEVTDIIDYSTLDVSGVTAVRLHSGYTGEKVWLTDPEDIKAITDLVVQIKGDSPESSRGYYGWTYGIDLYDTENPTEDSQSFWSAGMTWGTFTSSMYHYETIKNHRYN